MKKEYITDDFSGMEYIPLGQRDPFSFECTHCGNCCRNVKSAVPLETLDVFRIAKHMQLSIEEIITDYTEVELLLPIYPLLFLKTRHDDDACIFLKDGLCSIQQVKPRTCRMYPLSAGPRGPGELEYMWVAKQHHLYKPGSIKVGDWMNEAITSEDREFLAMEYSSAIATGALFKYLPESKNDLILQMMLVHKYLAYDTDKDFLPQYADNMVILVRQLRKLAEEK